MGTREPIPTGNFAVVSRNAPRGLSGQSCVLAGGLPAHPSATQLATWAPVPGGREVAYKLQPLGVASSQSRYTLYRNQCMQVAKWRRAERCFGTQETPNIQPLAAAAAVAQQAASQDAVAPSALPLPAVNPRPSSRAYAGNVDSGACAVYMCECPPCCACSSPASLS